MPSNCIHLTEERDSILRNYAEITKRIIYKSDQKIKKLVSKCRRCKKGELLTHINELDFCWLPWLKKKN